MLKVGSGADAVIWAINGAVSIGLSTAEIRFRFLGLDSDWWKRGAIGLFIMYRLRQNGAGGFFDGHVNGWVGEVHGRWHVGMLGLALAFWDWHWPFGLKFGHHSHEKLSRLFCVFVCLFV